MPGDLLRSGSRTTQARLYVGHVGHEQLADQGVTDTDTAIRQLIGQRTAPLRLRTGRGAALCADMKKRATHRREGIRPFDDAARSEVPTQFRMTNPNTTSMHMVKHHRKSFSHIDQLPTPINPGITGQTRD